jgi:hypothetical protein
MEACKSDLVTFIASTDVLSADYLARMEALANSSSANVIPNAIQVDKQGDGARFGSIVQSRNFATAQMPSRAFFYRLNLLEALTAGRHETSSVSRFLYSWVLEMVDAGQGIAYERRPFISVETL